MKVDSYDIEQYEGERIVSEIELLEDIGRKKYVLAYVKSLYANCLVPVKDIKKDGADNENAY